MNINTELYRTFFTVAKEGSISKAAELLFITQPAVSRSIRQLEEKTGCSLFFRTPKGVKLTKEGELLFQYIEQAFNFIHMGQEKLSEIRNLDKGEITIGVGDTICKHYLIPHLKDFHNKYPGINIHIENHTTPKIISLIRNGEIDFGIVNLPVDDKDLTIRKIMEIQDCFVVGEKYKELAADKRSLAEIIRYPMLLLEKKSNSRIYIERYFAQNQITVKPEIELGNFELLVHFAVIDFGVACVIKNFITYELSKSLLYEIPVKETIVPRNIGVAYLKSFPLSASAKKFLFMLMT